MFDKMKQVMEMQKKAKEVQKALEEVRVEKLSPGGKIRVVMNGNFRVVELGIDESVFTPAQKKSVEESLVKLLTDACQDVQRASAAQAMDLMKGMKLPGLG